MLMLPYAELSDAERRAVERFKEGAGETFNIKQAAAILGLTPRTLLSYVKAGRLHGVKIGGRWRFNGDELRRLLRGDD